MAGITETLVATPDGDLPSSRDIEQGLEDAQYWANLGSEAVKAAGHAGRLGYEPRVVGRPVTRENRGMPGYVFGPHVGRVVFTKPNPPISRPG